MFNFAPRFQKSIFEKGGKISRAIEMEYPSQQDRVIGDLVMVGGGKLEERVISIFG